MKLNNYVLFWQTFIWINNLEWAVLYNSFEMKVHDMGRSNIIPVKKKFKTTLEMEPQDEPRNTKIHPLSELKVLVKIGRFFGKLKNYE